MSATKASGEASALVLAHAEYVPRKLWCSPGMAPMDLCHSLTLHLAPGNVSTGASDDLAPGSDSRSNGTGSPRTGPRDRGPRPCSGGPPPQSAPQDSSVQLGLMYAVPQEGPWAGGSQAGPHAGPHAGAPSGQFSVNVAYPVVRMGSQHAPEMWMNSQTPPHMGGMPPQMQYWGSDCEQGPCRLSC